MSDIEKLTKKRKLLLWGGWCLIIFSPFFSSPSNKSLLPPVMILLGTASLIMARVKKKKIKALSKQIYLDELKNEADKLLLEIQKGTVNVIPQKAILISPEVGILSIMTKLYEIKSERIGSHVGSKVGKVYVGGSQSKSVENWSEAAYGELVLTTKRLIFVGDKRNIDWPLAKLSSIENLSDSIRVTGLGKTKPVIFSVNNPVLWCNITRALAQEPSLVQFIENKSSRKN